VRYGKQATHYKVHRGDTVQSVADEFGISAEKVRQWNHLRGNGLPSGRTLTIFKPASEAAGKQSDGSGSRHRGKPSHAAAQRDAPPPARGAKAKGIDKGSAQGKSGDRAAAAERKEKASDAGAVTAKKKTHHHPQD
jgi:LysM repeat protein